MYTFPVFPLLCMRKTVLFSFIATLMLVACGQVEPPKGSITAPVEEEEQTSSMQFGLPITDDTPFAIKATIAMIAEVRSMDPENIYLGFSQKMTFPNTCLGVLGLENCEDIPTDGYMMMFLVDSMTFLFHADEDANAIHLVSPDSLTIQIDDLR